MICTQLNNVFIITEWYNNIFLSMNFVSKTKTDRTESKPKKMYRNETHILRSSKLAKNVCDIFYFHRFQGRGTDKKCTL